MKFLGSLLLILVLMPSAVLAAPKAVGAPVAKTARTATPVARTTARADYNCTDFKTRAEVQKVFIAAGGPRLDPYRLDADKDGIPCEDIK